MRIHPFQGTRYVVDDAGDLAAAPYDQIDDSERDRLHQVAHHFAHLTRPVARDGLAPAEAAAELHRSWSNEGVVSRDRDPRFYASAIDLAKGERRLGLVAMVGLEPPTSAVIRPHERTVEKTVAERLDLLRAMKVDLEPILLLADDEGRLEELLSADLERYAPIASHTDAFGDIHHLIPLSSERNQAFVSALADAHGVIADGHHRYRTAALFAEETGADDGPAAAKLSVITSLASPALTIDPIHRAMPSAAPDGALPGVSERREAAAGDGADLAREVARVERSEGGPCLGYRSRQGGAEIWVLEPKAGPRDLPPAASELSVVLLHHALFPAFDLAPQAATDGTLRYRSDPDRLWSEIEAGRAASGIWLPPMSANLFQQAVAQGDLLPPKSTRFLPKVASGLVWCEHDTQLG